MANENQQTAMGYATEGRHILRAVGTGIITAVGYLALAGNGQLPTVELVYQAVLQFILAAGGSFGLTAASQKK